MIILADLGLYIFIRQRDLSQLYRSSVVVLSLIFTVIIYLMGQPDRFRDVFYTYAQFQEVSWDSVSENVYMNMRAPYSPSISGRASGGLHSKAGDRRLLLWK